jgi:threonine/homoserine/homoserine lactone efflux protein
LLNPTIGVFHSTLLAQFVVPEDSILAQSLGLALVHNAAIFVWLAT